MKPRKTKAGPLRVGGTTIRLPGADGLELQPELSHVVRHRFGGFADLDSAANAGIPHEIAVLITREAVGEAVYERGRSHAEADETWEALEPCSTQRTREEFANGELVVARMGIEEFPVMRYHDLRQRWGVWLDAIDGDAASAGFVADQLRAGEDSFALLDGSLLFVRGVSVHPALQGQQIGARLIAHALWALHRAGGDVAVLLAKPTENLFTGEAPRCGVRDIQRLVRYYERMGFERSHPEERVRAGTAVSMHLHLENPLPFRSLGEMGVG